MKHIQLLTLFWAGWIFSSGCAGSTAEKESNKSAMRIVSLSGSISEIIASVGATDKLVGVDVTSTYPEAVAQLPKTGHNRNINAEAVIALRPTHIFVFKEELKPELVQQFESAGITMVTFNAPTHVDGVRSLIKDVAAAVQQSHAAQALLDTLGTDLATLASVSNPPRVLFIYARGAGALSVAGRGTAVHEMLQFSGARNAAGDVEGFKPYTSESALKANPDVILLFESGLQSVGGKEGILNIPGIAQTNAGKAKRIYAMDGLLLSGFTPRTGKALQQLQSWWQQHNTQP